MARFRPILHAHNVTEQQWRVMRVLGEESPLDAGEVMQWACVLAPSLTPPQALEERGLISRKRDAGDGRRISLAIAPPGMALIREVTPQTEAVYAELEHSYGRERIEHLLDILDGLVIHEGDGSPLSEKMEQATPDQLHSGAQGTGREQFCFS